MSEAIIKTFTNEKISSGDLLSILKRLPIPHHPSRIQVVLHKVVAIGRSHFKPFKSAVLESLPNTLIIDYNSPAYYLVIWRAFGGVVWVGHGSQQGISTEQGVLTWQAFAAKVESAPSKGVVLACFSAAILSYLPESEVPVSFNGEVDAKLGALMVSYELTGNKATLIEAFQQVTNLLSGKVQPTLLMAPGEYYVKEYLTNFELERFICSVVFVLGLFLLPSLAAHYSGYVDAFATAYFPTLLYSIATIVTNWAFYLAGAISITTFVWNVWGILAGVVIAFVQYLPWYVILIAGIFWAFATFFSGGGYWVGAILGCIGGLVPAFVQLWHDYNSPN